jgi:hypothetical protein
VYASSPERDIINRLIHNKINVYVGQEDPQEHFMIIDDEKIIVSYKERNRRIPTPIGNRKGWLTDSPKEIKKYLLIFDRLKEGARKETIKGTDPLKRILNS